MYTVRTLQKIPETVLRFFVDRPLILDPYSRGQTDKKQQSRVNPQPDHPARTKYRLRMKGIVREIDTTQQDVLTFGLLVFLRTPSMYTL